MDFTTTAATYYRERERETAVECAYSQSAHQRIFTNYCQTSKKSCEMVAATVIHGPNKPPSFTKSMAKTYTATMTNE